MATNPYFQKFDHANEQNLIDNIIKESIKVYGHDVNYIVRTSEQKDSIFNEDDETSYSTQYPVEMYIKNVDGFEGEGDFVGRFGLEIRDQITFSVAKSTFAELQSNLARPREGDLIYFPLTKKIFEIQFVEHEAVFYQSGGLQTYDLQCELYEYSDEDFDTGITEIDQVETVYAFKTQIAISSLSGHFTIGETVTGAKSGVTGEVVTVNSTAVNLINMTGTFTAAETIVGATSGETAIIGVVTQEFVNDPQADNTAIETKSDGIIDFSENNPFSEEF